MTISVEATYENGILRPATPLPFQEHEKVRLTVAAVQSQAAPGPDEAESIVRRSHGLLGWTGDSETLRQIAEDPEFSILENP